MDISAGGLLIKKVDRKREDFSIIKELFMTTEMDLRMSQSRLSWKLE